MLSFLFRILILNVANVLVFWNFQIKLRNGFVKSSTAVSLYPFKKSSNLGKYVEREIDFGEIDLGKMCGRKSGKKKEPVVDQMKKTKRMHRE